MGPNADGSSPSTEEPYSQPYTVTFPLTAEQVAGGRIYLSYMADDAISFSFNGHGPAITAWGQPPVAGPPPQGQVFVNGCTTQEIDPVNLQTGTNTMVVVLTDQQYAHMAMMWSLCVYRTAQPTSTMTPTGERATALRALNRENDKTMTSTPTMTLSPTETPTLTPTITATVGGPAIQLAQTWPNVTDGKTPVKFHLDLARPCRIQVTVLNLVGEPVYQVIDMAQAGGWEDPWDVRTRAGAALSSGFYVVDWQVMDGHELTRKSTRLMIRR